MSSLQEIYFEKIADQYSYGISEEFPLVIDTETHWFNATKLCADGGRLLSDWLRMKSTREYIQYCNKKYDYCEYRNFLKDVKRNKNDMYDSVISGTYLPNELILGLAMWISNEVYDKVCKITQVYFVQIKMEQFEKNAEAVKRIVMKHMEAENKGISLKMKNQRFEHDVAPKTSQASKLNTLTIIQKNEENANYPFYMIRCQKGIYKKTLEDLRKRYPNLTVIHQIRYNPNDINLFNRMKENISYITTKFNNMKIEDGDVERLICDIDKLIPKLE